MHCVLISASYQETHESLLLVILNLITWLKWYLALFSTMKLLFFSFIINKNLVEEKHWVFVNTLFVIKLSLVLGSLILWCFANDNILIPLFLHLLAFFDKEELPFSSTVKERSMGVFYDWFLYPYDISHVSLSIFFLFDK